MNNFLIMPSNRIYRLGDVLYRRYSWKKERERILSEEKYINTFIHSYLSKLKDPLSIEGAKLRESDACYGLDNIEYFEESVQQLDEKLKNKYKTDDNTLYVNIRAGDIISLPKEHLFINSKDKLYSKIKKYINTHKEINKIKIITALHFGDNKNNNPKYQYLFSEKDKEKNITEIEKIVNYIGRNICSNISIIQNNEEENQENLIDRDFYILSYSKHAIIEDSGGFSKAVEDSRGIVRGEYPISLRPKISSDKISRKKLLISRREKAGFFSSCSLSLKKIIDFIQKNRNIPDVDFREFEIYKEKSTDNIYQCLFKENKREINVKEILNINFKLISSNIFYKDVDQVELRQLIERWFMPKDEIQKIKNNFIINTGIKTSSTLSIYYRGTDTQLDRGICYYNIFVRKAKEIIKKQNIKQVLIQTDDRMFEDYVLSSELNIPILKIDELESVYSNRGIHFNIKGDKIQYLKNMLSAVLLMSECKYNICNASNVSRWILFYKKNKEHFYQFVNNKYK